MNVRDIGDRFCEKYRQYFDAYLDNELPIETQRDVQQHMASCPGCARILDSRGWMKQLVRRAVEKEEAPVELVEALQDRYRSEPQNIFAHSSAGWMES